MLYKRFPPPPQLSKFVAHFWALEKNESEDLTAYALADNCLEFIFQIEGGLKGYERREGSIIRLQNNMPLQHEVEGRLTLFGARFCPWVANRFLNATADELIGEVLDFTAIFKQKGRDLEEQILLASNAEHRVELLSNFLSEYIPDENESFELIINHVIDNAGQVNIDNLVDQSGLSTRQFQRKFLSLSGFPLRYSIRLVKFQNVIRNLVSIHGSAIDKIIINHPYYDQSHLIRNFQEFAGVTPSQFIELLLGQKRGLFLPTISQ
jgi:AraC-like DNA-binding protein